MMRACWDECIDHYDEEVDDFFTQHFSDPERVVLFVAGAGFDPRARVMVKKLQPFIGDRLTCALIKEERPDPDNELVKRADKNFSDISAICKNINLYKVDIIAEDNAVVGGINVVRQMSKIRFCDYTDIIIDLSALSIGVSFPVVKLIYSYCDSNSINTNIHIVVVSNPKLDGLIKSNPTDRATEIRGFPRQRLLGQPNKAILWLPQLVSNRKAVLGLLYGEIKPHDVCPILPFFPSVPKKGDNIIGDFLAELSEWSVDPRNFIYADESNPLDLYRSILQIHDQRGPVFETFGGSAVILSPLGSKVLAIGALMAALERNLPILYVETLSYQINWDDVDKVTSDSPKLTHIWLSGEAYTNEK